MELESGPEPFGGLGFVASGYNRDGAFFHVLNKG
jgi:hypothetical protein